MRKALAIALPLLLVILFLSFFLFLSLSLVGSSAVIISLFHMATLINGRQKGVWEWGEEESRN